jgi:hypothetical protein
MRTIAEMNVLLRVRVELPVGLKMATDEFREGWNFLRTVNVQRLEKKIRKRGWNFIKIATGDLRSGVGPTAQEAIASALNLALRRVSEHFNAVEVEEVELIRYPWFFLARVKVYAYRIQESAVLPVSDEPVSIPMKARVRKFPPVSTEMPPDFSRAIPMMREMLTSRVPEARAS